jgi:hypothetical protein
MWMLAAMAIGLATFLTCSASLDFANWPWTASQEMRDGVLGFEAGQTKKEALANAIERQRDNEIAALRLLDGPPATYKEKFKGFDLQPSDIEELSESDEWHVAISGRNAWLEVTFDGDRLARIVKKTYRGPTK